MMQRQLETLGAQRAGLEDMLKEMRRKVCLTCIYFSSLPLEVSILVLVLCMKFLAILMLYFLLEKENFEMSGFAFS